MKTRCAWAGTDGLYIKYHDEEWAVPVHDDQKLFEFLVLEGAQTGLSWITILKRREGYRKAFKNFNPVKVAKMTQAEVEKLLNDTGIIRNRLKIESTVSNAKVILEIQREFGSFSKYMWNWVNDKPVQNHWKTTDDIPAQTELSVAIAKDLKRRGCKFFGPVICYAFMQATGMVNDHTTACFKHTELS